MRHEIYLPKIDKRTENCRLIEWRVEPGDRIKCGDILLVYETQKASMILEAAVSGILETIWVTSGSWVRVSAPVGVILT